jgi:hypothetical protein
LLDRYVEFEPAKVTGEVKRRLQRLIAGSPAGHVGLDGPVLYSH